MSYASDTEDYGDVAGKRWPGEGSDIDSGAPPATPAHVASGLTLPFFHLRPLESASEYAQSDEDQYADAMDVDDGGASDGTDEEVEDRPPSDSGRDDELDQQGAQEFEYVHPHPISQVTSRLADGEIFCSDSRLIKSIKSTTDLTSSTPFLKNQNMEADADDVDDDFMAGLRAATGVGKRKRLVSIPIPSGRGLEARGR